MSLPIYECTVKGDAHEQIFTVICHVDELKFETQGESTSRRKAEQIAAKAFLNKIEKNPGR